MYERKKVSSLLRIKLRQQMGNPRALMGYLLGCVQAVVIAMRYIGFSAGWSIGVFEPYTILMNYWADMALLLLGFYLVISDAPFVDCLSQTMLLRADQRKNWTRAMMGYIFLNCALYWAAVLLASMLPCLFTQRQEGNVWSETMRILVEIQPQNAISKWGLNLFSGSLTKEWNPYGAVFAMYALAVLHGVDMALVIYALNLKTGKPAGSLAALAILFFGAIVIYNSDMLPVRISPLANGMLCFHGKNGISFGFSVTVFLVLLLVLLVWVKRVSETCDFRVANGERLW